MFKYQTQKRDQYYDKCIGLYVNQHLGCRKISKIIPVSKNTVSRRISNFAADNQDKSQLMSNRIRKNSRQVTGKPSDSASQESTETSDADALKKEIARQKKELAHESLRAKAIDTMVDLAEKQFNIPIKKSLAPNGRGPACK